MFDRLLWKSVGIAWLVSQLSSEKETTSLTYRRITPTERVGYHGIVRASLFALMSCWMVIPA